MRRRHVKYDKMQGYQSVHRLPKITKLKWYLTKNPLGLPLVKLTAKKTGDNVPAQGHQP